MSEWVSWLVAVAKVRHGTNFTQEEAERLLHAAIRHDDAVKVQTDNFDARLRNFPGYDYLPTDGPRENDGLRPYRRINYVNLPSLVVWLAELKSDPASAGMKHKGGREPKYDYEGGLIELARAAYDGDLKIETRDDAFRWLQDWMAKQYLNGGPDPRMIRQRSDRFFDALKPPENRKT